MWPSKWLRIENESPGLLAQCRGLRGQAWAYSTSHSEMLVRFYRDGSLAGIYLFCKSCDLVQFQSSWLDADVRVEISQGQYGPVYTITDGDRLRIVCGAAFLAESPELISLQDQFT
jgi:hypothetical protein